MAKLVPDDALYLLNKMLQVNGLAFNPGPKLSPGADGSLFAVAEIWEK